MNETPTKPTEAVQTNPFQQTLQSMGAHVTAILETTSDAVLVLNKTGIVYANPAVSELWGIPLRELQARGFDWTSLLGSAARAGAEQVLRTALEGPQSTRKVSFRAMARHLGERSFTGSLTRVDGDEPKVLAILHDISDQVTSGNEWKQRTKLLEEIGRANQMVLLRDLPYSHIGASMEILRRATCADRVCIQLTDGPAIESGAETAQVCVGVAADPPQIPIPPRWRTMLAEGLPVPAVTADLPPEEREPLEAQAIRALLALPLTAGEVCRGLIPFDRMSTEVLWSEEAIVVLQTGVRAWSSALALAEIQYRVSPSSHWISPIASAQKTRRVLRCSRRSSSSRKSITVSTTTSRSSAAYWNAK